MQVLGEAWLRIEWVELQIQIMYLFVSLINAFGLFQYRFLFNNDAPPRLLHIKKYPPGLSQKGASE